MTKMRIMSVVTALSLAIALFTAVASAAVTGVMVISGGVTLDGAKAPAGTTVTAALADGTVLGAGKVGDGGADVYRINVQVDSTWEGLSANLNVGGATQATQATVVIKANSYVAQDITVVTPVTATAALAALVNTQNVNIVTAFDYASGKYLSYVPALAGNSLTTIAPNSVIVVTMTQDTTIIVSGITFPVVKANVPTPLPVGAAVTITVQ